MQAELRAPWVDRALDKGDTLCSKSSHCAGIAEVQLNAFAKVHTWEWEEGRAATCWKKVFRMRMWSHASRRALLYCASVPAPVITQGASLCASFRPPAPFLAALPFSWTQNRTGELMRLRRSSEASTMGYASRVRQPSKR